MSDPCKPHQSNGLICQSVLLDTAEGIEIEFQPAGLGIRSIAFVIDLGVRLVIFILLALLVGFFGDFGTGLMLIGVFLLEWFYPIIFEYYWGATPGKKLTGLKVIYANGLPLTLPGAMTRNLFRTIDFLPFAYCLGAISMLTSKQFQRIGDWVAGTMVVYQNENKTYHPAESQQQFSSDFVLSTEEQVAVIRFAEREPLLSKSRSKELAAILSPLFKSNLSASECLKAMANRYLGK
ncbi:RDD family protein [Gayadomonas joobiniege]|uniref:RDD family protein n=1 Tax=Gayadomonas joobiniege TaxID=1234606 RepID=UPI0003740AFD|nr:RDD family protein [Gayadomonas joobiniege]